MEVLPHWSLGAPTSLVIGLPASDLTALQQGVHVALSLRLLEAIFGHDLRYQIVLARERGQLLLGKLAPLRTDFLEDDLLGLRGGLAGGWIGGGLIHIDISIINTKCHLNDYHPNWD